MVRSIELENNGARNLYAEMLKIMTAKGYPKGWPIDVLIDFETISEKRLYETGKPFLWIVRENGTYLYHECWVNEYDALKFVMNETGVKNVYLISIGKYESVNVVEIINDYLNVFQAYLTLPAHVYAENES